MATTTKYIWDDDNIVAEADQNDAVNVVYTYEPQQYGNLISTRIGGTSFYHHFDALGSTRQLTNAAGTVTDRITYDAWGNVVSRTGTTPISMLWIGEIGYYYDAETALFSVRERPYETSIGRWTAPDPIMLINALSQYVYADNRPLLIVDPSGLKPSIVIGDWTLTLEKGPSLLTDILVSYSFEYRQQLPKRLYPNAIKEGRQKWLLTQSSYDSQFPNLVNPTLCDTSGLTEIKPTKDVTDLIPAAIIGANFDFTDEQTNRLNYKRCWYSSGVTIIGGISPKGVRLPTGADKPASPAEVAKMTSPDSKCEINYSYYLQNKSLENCNCCNYCTKSKAADFECMDLPWPINNSCTEVM